MKHEKHTLSALPLKAQIAEPHPNPKILHRIYFSNFSPFHDPFLHFRETWLEQLPDYKIMDWNLTNLDVGENEWTRRAFKEKNPVFLSEYFRWKVLAEFGGVYIDADCEMLDGKIFGRIVDELYQQDAYDVFFGIEERSNGHPTAQTVGAKRGAGLVDYMIDLYVNRLTPLWHWREQRGLIGPQLMSLYFHEKGINTEYNGFFKNLDDEIIVERAKVYPQEYFSPKFGIKGESINYDSKKTCIYHMFANSNVDFSGEKDFQAERHLAARFSEYTGNVKKQSGFPRRYGLTRLRAGKGVGEVTPQAMTAIATSGLVSHGPYISLERGSYRASLTDLRAPTTGFVTLSITADHGARMLASKTVTFTDGLRPDVSVSFEVDRDFASNLEFLVHIDNADTFAFSSIGLDQRDPSIRRSPAVKPGSLKILHRIYFGFDGKPDQFQAYLETWREQLPDFKIVFWNASNLPMQINAYVRQLYEERDHAFLTDFFRWYVLREYGGVYLDADIEVVNGDIFRRLVAELEQHDSVDAFIGIDERGGGWYTAHSVASKPASDFSEFMCSVYENFGSFAAWRKKGMYFWAPQLTALYFANRDYNKGGMGTTPALDRPVVVERVKIYPQDWFSPLSPSGDAAKPFRLDGLSENTCLCHHFACSWHDESSFYAAHSRVRGGQANMLLRDLVSGEAGVAPQRSGAVAAPDPRTIRIDSTDRNFQTEVGLKEADGIRAIGASGRLVYGPYVTLAAGEYEACFTFADVEALGEVIVDVVTDFGKHTVHGPTIVRGLRGGCHFKMRFGSAKAMRMLECRLNVNDQSRFRVEQLEIQPVDPSLVARVLSFFQP